MEGSSKAPYSIVTTPRYMGGHHFLPCFFPLTLDSYLIILSVRQAEINYYFFSLWYDLAFDWNLVSRNIDELFNKRSGPAQCHNSRGVRHNNRRIKGKSSNPWKGVVSSPTPWCYNYWKWNHRFAFDYYRPTLLIYGIRARTHIWVRKTACLIRLTLHQVGRSAAQTSRVRVSARSRPPLPFIPTIIYLRAFDLVSSRVWWEAATIKRLFLSRKKT